MSPRCKKHRHCGCEFHRYQGLVYKPLGIPAKDLPVVHIQQDELEAMRLCDLEDLTQEEAGLKMGVSRGTVQRLLTSARKKMIKAIVEQASLAFVR